MKTERINDEEENKNVYNVIDKLEPILKWPGGKESELKYILPSLPKTFENYYEPFVGGGSVYKSIKAKHYLVNDKSHELISFYRMISEQNIDFFNSIKLFSSTWIAISDFSFKNDKFLINLYKRYKNGDKSQEDVKRAAKDFVDYNREILSNFFSLPGIKNPYDIEQLKKVLSNKVFRIKLIEDKNDELPEIDILQNLETAFKAAYYNYIRELYNQADALKLTLPLRIAFFYFLRNFAYSGMFRYSSKGNFNVPYGGIGYNRNNLSKKINYFLSDKIQQHIARTTFECLDFQNFFEKHTPTDNDFIFLDPPYDSEFSTYANNAFGIEDQKRLAYFLINKCAAKWMMIINNTDFIYSLYNVEKLSIQPFDKNYLVSFMNRNDKKTEHLLIKNY